MFKPAVAFMAVGFLWGCAGYDSRVPDTRIPEGELSLPPAEAAIPDTRERGLPPEHTRPEEPAPLPRGEAPPLPPAMPPEDPEEALEQQPETLVPPREPVDPPRQPLPETRIPEQEPDDVPRPDGLPDALEDEWRAPDMRHQPPPMPGEEARPTPGEPQLPTGPPVRPGERDIPRQDRGATWPALPDGPIRVSEGGFHEQEARGTEGAHPHEEEDEQPGAVESPEPGAHYEGHFPEDDADHETTIPRRERLPTDEHRDFHPDPFGEPEVEESPFQEHLHDWYEDPPEGEDREEQDGPPR